MQGLAQTAGEALPSPDRLDRVHLVGFGDRREAEDLPRLLAEHVADQVVLVQALHDGLRSSASRRLHDASFFERVVRRTCVLNSTICVFERLICQGIPLVIWWPDNRPF